MGIYRRALLPALHLVDPERSHNLAVGIASAFQALPAFLPLLERLSSYQHPSLALTWRGLRFRNPVGVAAGADKNARLPRVLAALGAGFVEVGTVTPRPQPGNPRPRIFRLPAQRALVNRLGFPSVGAERVARRLSRARRGGLPLGINIGKNSATPLDQAAEDYLRCLETLYPFGDYFVVNVSSPNTEGLTSLQTGPRLAALMQPIMEKGRALAQAMGGPPKPVLVKLSADLSPAGLDSVLRVAWDLGIDGAIAVNTSADPGLRDGTSAGLAGGLSGPPLRQRALEIVAHLRRSAPPGFFLIGVGGVSNAADAWALLRAGADAVQLYTALVYEGPGLVGAINRGLLARMREEGVASLAAAQPPRIP